MTKDEFLDAWEKSCVEAVVSEPLWGYEENIDLARDIYRVIALKLMEGMQDSGERWSMCSVHPGLHAQHQDCKLTTETLWRLTLPKEQSE